MFEIKMNELSLDKLHRIAIKLPINRNHILYKDSYNALIQFTRESISKIDETTLIALAHMAYGWMPTMLKKTEIRKDYLEILRRINAGENTIDLYRKLSSITNNSIVGASKLLHFINPEKYGIFDSRVYKSITRCKTTDANNGKKYVIYISKVRELIEQNEHHQLKEIKNELIKKNYLEKEHTPFRTIEVCLYAGSK
jgi:hypothetical protein